MRASVLPLFAAVAAVSLLALTQQPTPVSPADLIGEPFAAALRALGPPERGSGTTGCQSFRWRGADGGTLELTCHRGIVVGVEDRLEGPLVQKPVPVEGHYPGQPLEELLARLGHPTRVVREPRVGRGPAPMVRPGEALPVRIADLELDFGELRLLVSEGRVLGPAPEPRPVHGPR